MIQLEQNSKNNVTVSVSGLSMTTGSLYLFEFISGQSKQKIYTLAYNSSSLNRYDSFCITTVTGSANSSSGEIYAPLSGQYLYNIYESPTGSFDPTGLNLVETGKMRIVSSSRPITAYTGSQNQYIIYNG